MSPLRARPLGGALLALLATILFWSSVPLLLKYFTHRIDAWTVNGLRYCFSAMFWLPVVVRHREARQLALWRAAWLPAVFHGLGQIGWGLAPYLNDASVLNFVSRASFLFTIVAGFIWLREERALAHHPLFWLGTVGTLAGILILFGGGAARGSTSLLGIAVILWTSLCWALYAVQVRRRLQRFPAPVGFGAVSLLVAPILVVLLFALGNWRTALHMSPGLWALIALSAWVGISLGHVLYYKAVRLLGPIAAEGGLAVIPFLTALLARPTLGEHLAPAQWGGGILLVGATLCLLGAKKQTAREPLEEPVSG